VSAHAGYAARARTGPAGVATVGTRPVRIAMWSGPRNLSTAMMRAFENRPDTAVWDEPLYGCYLHATGIPHPGAEEVMAAWGTDWRAVVAGIVGPVPGDKPVFYQKHMAHHLLPAVTRGWLDEVQNCFLIRAPGEVLASYREVRPDVTAADLGFVQQAEIFTRVLDSTGAVPPVLDARDVLEHPEGMLRALCAALGIDFDARMLSWPPGPRASDGPWARHWYASVEASSGFGPPRAREVALDAGHERVRAACEPHYRLLHEHRLRAR